MSSQKRLTTFIQDAVEKKLSGDATNYEWLVKQIAHETDQAALAKVFDALSFLVSFLTKHRVELRELCGAIFGYKWSSASTATVVSAKALEQLVTSLVSSSTAFLTPSFEMLVLSFAEISPHSAHAPAAATAEAAAAAAAATGVATTGAVKSSVASSGSSVPAIVVVELKADGVSSAAGEAAVAPAAPSTAMSRCVHSMLRSILRVAPASMSKLLAVVKRRFPHKLRPSQVQCRWVGHVLLVAEYTDALRSRLFTLVVRSLIEIDVEIKPTTSEIARGEEGGGAEGDGAEGDSDGGDGARDGAAGASSSSTESSMATKLDDMMWVVFTHLAASCDASTPPPAASQLFAMMLEVLDECILPTHRSRFAQFLVFFVASRRPKEFTAALIEHLLAVIDSPERPSALRQTCALYVGSFIARAPFVEGEQVRAVLEKMNEWMHEYLDCIVGGTQSASAVSAAAAPSASALPAAPSASARSGTGTPAASFSGRRVAMLQRRTPALAGTPHGTPAVTPSRRPRLAGTPHGTPRAVQAAGLHPNGTPLNLFTKLMQVAEASKGDGSGGSGGGDGGSGSSSSSGSGNRSVGGNCNGALSVDVRASVVSASNLPLRLL